MTIAFTLSIGAMVVLAISLALFIGCTLLAWRQGMFDTYGGYAGGLDGLFLFALYACLWALPSLLAWVAWATWWKL